MEIKKKDVPKWLRKTNFYNSLEKDGNFTIKSEKYIKENENILSLKDLKSYVKTVNFWMDELDFELSESSSKFIKNNIDDTLSILYKYHNLPTSKYLIKKINSINYRLTLESFNYPHFFIIKFFYDDDCICDFSFTHYEDLEGVFSELSDNIKNNKNFEFDLINSNPNSRINKSLENVVFGYKNKNIYINFKLDKNDYKNIYIPVNNFNREELCNDLNLMNNVYSDFEP